MITKVQEKIVYIKRKPSKHIENNQALKVMNDNATKYLGSAGYSNTELPVTGLDEIEKAAILPSLVQVSANHVEFDEKVNNYYHELRELVPAGRGLRLNITTVEKEFTYAGKTQVIEFPKHPKDYVLYRRAIAPEYKQCGKSLEQAKAGGNRVRFYIHDLELAQKAEVLLGEWRDKAYAAYLEIADNTANWESILLVHGINPDLLSKVEQKSKLRSLAVADGIKEMDEQTEAFEKFVTAVGDKDIELKATLNKFVNAKLILVVDTSYIYDNGSASVTIGNEEREAILWLKDAKNSKDYQILLAKLNSKK
jgi:hypothetical protein